MAAPHLWAPRSAEDLGPSIPPRLKHRNSYLQPAVAFASPAHLPRALGESVGKHGKVHCELQKRNCKGGPPSAPESRVLRPRPRCLNPPPNLSKVTTCPPSSEIQLPASSGLKVQCPEPQNQQSWALLRRETSRSRVNTWLPLPDSFLSSKLDVNTSS